MGAVSLRWDEIEAEHASLLNALLRIRVLAAESKLSAAVLLPACLDLVRRFEEHFSHEERIMAAAAYPEAVAHHRHHQVLLARLLAICSRMTKEETVEIEQLQLALQTLFDDAIGVDAPFREFLEQKS